MDDAQIRIACLDAAVRTVGNPNTVNLAKDYYAFVTEGFTCDETTNVLPNETSTKIIATNLIHHTPAPQKGQKEKRK